MKILVRLYKFLHRLVCMFSKQDVSLPKAEYQPDISSECEKKCVSESKKNENAVDGDYLSAKALLDDLNQRYEWLRGFKPNMSNSGLRAIKKFGIYMAPTNTPALVNRKKLDGGKNRKYPTFIAVSINHPGDQDTVGWGEMVLYAEKHKWKNNAFNVEKPSGQYFYEFGYVVRLDNKYYPITTALEVTKNGEINILRVMDVVSVTLPRKRTREPMSMDSRGRPLRGSSNEIYIRQWKKKGLLPTARMEARNETAQGDIEKMTKELFTFMFNLNLRRDASTSIHATKGNTRMVFSVPADSWKDFFKDRIKVKAPDGKNKRIFHHVAAHRRRNGQVVPMHTRGITRFKWGGFNIKICEWKKGRLAFTDLDFTGEVMSEKEYRDHLRNNGNVLMGTEEMATRMIPHLTKDLHKPSAANASN